MAYIKNYSELAISPEREDALTILEAGYEAINTERVIRSKLKMEDSTLLIEGKEFSLSQYENVYFIGIGKCALEAGRVLESVLGDYIKDGVVIDNIKGNLKTVRTYTGSHPWPSKDNVSAAEEIVKMLDSVSEKDLVITVISGGGSALLSLPYRSSVETVIEVTKTLTKKGADIYELNTVRKHLSLIKGGQLAKMTHPAETLSLIFSDVLGDDISVIASGPTVKDGTSVKDAESILKRYGLFEEFPSLELTETPKEDTWFERVHNILFVTNTDAIEAMERKAREIGYETVNGSNIISGEAQNVGKSFANTQLKPKQVQISGGETTVNITGSGKGGRNQETALSALPYLKDGTVFISAASDGIDNTDVAGALCDSRLMEVANKLLLDPNRFISENDSYNFFTKVGGQIVTDPTGSNVSDLYILLNYK